MAFSTPNGIPSGGEDLKRQSPRIHIEPLMRSLKVILVGTCGLAMLWVLMVWFLAPEEFTNHYLPQILQKPVEENSVGEVTVKKKANAPTNLLSMKFTGTTSIAVESPENKPSSEPVTDLVETLNPQERLRVELRSVTQASRKR